MKKNHPQPPPHLEPDWLEELCFQLWLLFFQLLLVCYQKEV